MAIAKYFGLIAAAGRGERFTMGDESNFHYAVEPKQYVKLAGEPMLTHALRSLCDGTPLARTFVVLAPDDRLFVERVPAHPRVTTLYCGGATRGESVYNALHLMRGEAHERDWILVHDAARPCLPRETLTRLLATLADDPVGGLLALPVADTIKIGDDAQRVTMTASRDGRWQAQTPQMFRYGLLLEAMRSSSAVTDEAQAIEFLGKQPKLVMGSSLNIKVTVADDLLLAESILSRGANRQSSVRKGETL